MQPLVPHWTAYLTALSTPCVAIFAAWIALQQWKLSRNKLRLDLFDRRWAVYAATNDVLASLIAGPDEARQACVKNFRRRLIDAQFLFGHETLVFLRGVEQRVGKFGAAEMRLRETPFEATNRRAVEQQVMDEIAACQADFDALGTVFGADMHIHF